MGEVLQKRFPDMVALFTGLGFLTVLAELVLTDHTEGIRILAPLAAGMGAGAILLGLGFPRGRVWATGLLLLVGGFLAAAWGEGLLFSLLLAFVAMGMTDNPFSVPSPFRGEIFFLVGGMALARGVRLPATLGLAGAAALLWSLPFLYLATRPPTPPPALAYLAFPQEGVGFLRLAGAEGYRVQVWLCQKGCQRLGWEWPGDRLVVFPLPQDLPPGEYRLRILLFSQHRLALKPRYVLEREVRR